MFEILVALRRQQLEVDALDEAAPVDADLLRRHADPGVTRRGQGAVEEAPVGRGVDAGRHVVPLDDDRPAEAQRILGPARHEPGPEGSLGTGGHVPVAVGTALALQFVGPRRPFEAVLDLLVAERGQVVVPHDVRRRARHLLEHSLSCAGHGEPPWVDAARGGVHEDTTCPRLEASEGLVLRITRVHDALLPAVCDARIRPRGPTCTQRPSTCAPGPRITARWRRS